VPRPLLFLLLAVGLVGAAWALFVPPLQAPDENSHFGYAQRLAESFELPGDADRKVFSTEQDLAQDRSNSDQVAGILQTKPEWSEQAYDRWQSDQARLPDSVRDDGGGPNPASTNPPLYYLYELPAYLAASAGDLFDRLYVMRLWSALLLLVTTTATWLLAGELFGPRRLLQVVAAGVAGLQPMVTFLSAAVTPDAMLFALWSVALLLGVRVLKRRLTPANGIALMAVVGLAVVTKASSYALVPAALLALAVGAARLPASRRRVLSVVAVALAALAIPVGTWLVTARVTDRPAVNQVATAPGEQTPSITNFNVRELGSYMWQYYLPRLPFQQRFGGLPEYPVYAVWLKGSWGTFGWLEVRFPQPVYLLFAAFTLAALLGAAVFLVRRRAELDLAVVAFFALVVLALLAGLHWTEFRTLVGGTGPFTQGRYLLPLVSLFGAAVAAAVAVVPERRRVAAAGGVLGFMFAAQVFSFAILTGRFYV
jgi:4-amino-4-deoxy-L-arabinose transferase-like glycosyltransferase